ncbi:tol-pal system protein YbgF [Accumulibacter sp.]|uniref:tol-pal system protein YbgF n=1 Tax=Accumulibacter sp. TaxID=2053492 RepID=UPI0035B2274A
MAGLLTRIGLCAAVLAAQPLQAGLFDDDEARRQIKDLAIKTNERLDTVAKGQIELANQIQALRDENSRLRGQVETLTYELDAARKRQQDFYVDLDGRLRKLEPLSAAGSDPKPAADDGKAPVDTPKKTASDPATEAREYEAALNLFRANKLKEAATAFEAFARAHPESSLTPNAYYWLGNAQYSQRDCKKAIDAHRVVASKWPANSRAPEALLNIATCQQELADAKGAKATLEAIVAKYPDSAAATTAKQRLKK